MKNDKAEREEARNLTQARILIVVLYLGLGALAALCDMEVI